MNSGVFPSFGSSPWIGILVICAGLMVAEPGAVRGATDDDCKAGVARVVITPQELIWMAGYGARDKPADGKLQDLYAQALALESPTGERLVLVTTDLIGLPTALTESVADSLQNKHGLARAQVMFTSSHTHSGPLLADEYPVYPLPGLAPQEEEKVRRYTQLLPGQLIRVVGDVLAAEMHAVAGPVRAALSRVDLPLDKLPTREELAERAKGKPSYAQRRAEWLLKILEERGKFDTTYPYPIQAWQLGSDLTWIALGGEAVVDYSLRLKRELGPTAWVAAYANDVMEYIPSRRVLKEGGYEAEIFSADLAGAAWAPSVEDLIVSNVHQLVTNIRRVFHNGEHNAFTDLVRFGDKFYLADLEILE